jgi:hypothetical protein
MISRRTPDWCREQAALLGEKYGKDRLNAACARANASGDPSYHTIKNILEKGLDQELPLTAPVVTAGAFLRGPEELFLEDEVQRRANKSLAARVVRARFEEKTFDTLDFTYNPKIPAQQIRDLATCQFIQRQE